MIPFLKHSRIRYYKTETNSTCEVPVFTTKIAIPTCRIESRYIANNESDSLNSKITQMRLSCNMSAKELADKININSATLSRYERGKFSIERIDINILQNIAIACGYERELLLTPFLKFKLYKEQILTDYITINNISKSELAKQLNVSYTLVKSWFINKNRSPSHNVWQTAFKDFTLQWLKNKLM